AAFETLPRAGGSCAVRPSRRRLAREAPMSCGLRDAALLRPRLRAAQDEGVPLLRSYGEVGGQEVRISLPTHPTSETKMTNLDHPDAPTGEEYATVYVAFELSKAKWKIGVILPGSAKLSRYMIGGGDVAALEVLLAKVRAKAEHGGKVVRIVACYEAGF